MRVFTTSMAKAIRRSSGTFAEKYLSSRSMPMEMKKRELNVSLKGKTSATIWFEYSLSEIMSPATEGARGRRQAGQSREPRRSETYENYRQDEDLAVTELDDLVKEFGYD